jgi:3-hydroxybutyrate dehydrogenase
MQNNNNTDNNQQHQQQMTSVLITGSLTGIGFGIAQSFARMKNVNIMLNGLETSAASQLESIRNSSRPENKIEYCQADLAKVSDIERLISTTERPFGRLDAGIQYVAPIAEFPVDKWDQVLAINLTSVYHTTRLALPQMRKQQFGRIINVASVHGHMASIHKAAYVAAKHGVIGLTKTVALEVAKENITCNAVCPGWVLTPLVEKQIQDRAAKSGRSYEAEMELLVGEKMPSGKPATVEEIGAACMYLALPSTKSTNGTSMMVDGAWTAGKL